MDNGEAFLMLLSLLGPWLMALLAQAMRELL
jgi:hypothetical protein